MVCSTKHPSCLVVVGVARVHGMLSVYFTDEPARVILFAKRTDMQGTTRKGGYKR